MNTPYSNEKQIELVLKSQKGDEEALELLVMSYHRMLKAMSGKFSGMGLDFDDLYQEGAIGLIGAVRDFDPDRGTRFSTYAWVCVNFACATSITRYSRVVRIPDYKVHELRDIHNTGKTVDDQKHEQDKEAFKVARSLNCEIHSDTNETYLDRITGDLFESFDDVEEREQLQVAMGELLSGLPDHESNIIKMYHGFNGVEQTHQAIANELGCSKQNVNQIYHNGMRRIRSRSQRKLNSFELK